MATLSGTCSLDLALSSTAQSAAALSPANTDRLQQIARSLLDHVEAISEEVNRRAIAHEPQLADPEGAFGSEMAMESTRANVGAAISMLAYGVPATAGQPAVGALRLFEAMADRDDGLAIVLRGYRVGIMELLQIWSRYLAAEVPDPADLYALHAASTSFMLTYMDRVCTGLHQQWQATRRRHQLRSVMLPEDLVRAALSGPAETADLSPIHYDLDRTHVAAALDPTLEDDRVRQLTSRLALEVDGCACALHLGAGWVIWIGFERSLDTRRRHAAETTLDALHSTVGLGDPAPGIAGFRTTYREALDARRVGLLRRDRGITRHHDIALLAVLCADTDRARALAQAELGPLAGSDPAATRLRETLRAYLRHGENQIATAHALGVHQKTVAYRLRQVEARLGRRVDERRAELEAALLLDRVFTPPAGLTGPAGDH